MTNRSKAAAAFASAYGTFDSLTGEYQLNSNYGVRLSPSRSMENLLRDERDTAWAAVDKSNDAAQRAKKDRDELLTIVMSLLGVEGQYADTVETREVFSGSYNAGYVERDVITKTAAQKFADDLRAAKSAVDGQAALKRIRKAVKTVTKEQSK